MDLCATCGVEYDRPLPQTCPICADERQYVPATGQAWTDLQTLEAQGHRVEVTEVEHDLLGLTVSPAFGIGQRSLVVTTPHGTLLWDPVGFLDDQAVAAILAHGPVLAIAASHPHMFGAQVQWSRRLGGAPVLVNARDRAWIQRADRVIALWDDDHEVAPGLTLHRIGGHFPGSAVAAWDAGARGRGALLVGDTIFPNPDRRTLGFLRSYPNRLPLSAGVVRRIASDLARLRFDRVYGNFANAIEADAAAAVATSAARHIAWVSGEHDDLT